jgi:hypothetical protein
LVSAAQARVDANGFTALQQFDLRIKVVRIKVAGGITWEKSIRQDDRTGSPSFSATLC